MNFEGKFLLDIEKIKPEYDGRFLFYKQSRHKTLRLVKIIKENSVAELFW